MKLIASHPVVCASLVTCLATAGLPKMHGQNRAHRLPNLAWTRDYAIPYTAAKQSSIKAKNQQRLNWSPHLGTVLHAAFPQRQWFLKDHGKFWSVPVLTQTYLAVSGRSGDLGASAWLDDGRYVTADGCLPHACFDRGMLWMDTASSSRAVIFVATDIVASSSNGDTRVWVFVSGSRLGNTLPTAFRQSAKRWYDDNQAQGYAQKIILATIVSPDGGMRDVGFEEIVGKATAAGATQ